MDYYFEVPTVKKVKVNIEECPCCGSKNLKFDKVDTGNGCDRFTGYAYIECNTCNHRVEKESSNIGYGDTLDGLFRDVLIKWNSQCKRHKFKDELLVKALAVAFNDFRFVGAHIEGDYIVFHTCNTKGSESITELERELDRRINKM